MTDLTEFFKYSDDEIGGALNRTVQKNRELLASLPANEDGVRRNIIRTMFCNRLQAEATMRRGKRKNPNGQHFSNLPERQTGLAWRKR